MKKIILFLTFFIITSSLFSQRVCPTTADLILMQQEDPARYASFMNLENFIATTIVNQGTTNQRLINANGIITIPVVVHVLHRGENIGTGRNISIAQIQSQIDVLNEDFRRLNPNSANTPAGFLPIAADYGFEFKLACTDPNGLSTDGIVRKQTNKSSYEFLFANGTTQLPDEVAMSIKVGASGSEPWPTDRYFNIWVCSFSGGTLGYGTFPADFAARPNFDGIVVHTTAFGRVGNVETPFNGGRTATHEVGHWLDLRHIWGDANCGNDFVPDTPPQQSANRNCPIFPRQTPCNNTTNGEMFMNYMDYTDDACMNIYTNGQRQRGRAIFAPGGPRFAFLNNYFRLEPRISTLYCNGKVKISNPNCFPVTWSVISGAATITTSNDNQATISSTASGTIRLRATGGNYLTEQDYLVSQETPYFGATYKNGITDYINPIFYDPNLPNNVNGVCIGFAFPNNYIDGQPVGSSDNSILWGNPVPVPNSGGFSLFQQIGNRGYFRFLFNTPTVGLVQGTVVGCGSYTRTFAFVPVNCNPMGGNPCDVAKTVNYYTISPNPATDQIVIGVGDRHAPVSCDFLKSGSTPSGITFYAVNIYNNLGTLVKSYKSSEGKQATIQIGNLITGNYVVEIITSDYVEKQQIIVQ